MIDEDEDDYDLDYQDSVPEYHFHKMLKESAYVNFAIDYHIWYLMWSKMENEDILQAISNHQVTSINIVVEDLNLCTSRDIHFLVPQSPPLETFFKLKDISRCIKECSRISRDMTAESWKSVASWFNESLRETVDECKKEREGKMAGMLILAKCLPIHSTNRTFSEGYTPRLS